MLSSLVQITGSSVLHLRRIEEDWSTPGSVMWKLTNGRSSPQSCIECGMCFSRPLYSSPVVRCTDKSAVESRQIFGLFNVPIRSCPSAWSAPDTNLPSHPHLILPLLVASKARRSQYPAWEISLFGSLILLRGDQRGEAGSVSYIYNMRKSLV